MDVDEQLRHWGVQQRQRATVNAIDPISIIRTSQSSSVNKGVRRFLAPAAAIIAVGAIVGVVVAVVDRESAPHRGSPAAPAVSTGVTKTPGAATMGCGVEVPPHASSRGYDAVLSANASKRSWDLTIRNTTNTRIVTDRNAGLSAYDSNGRITAQSYVTYDLNPLVIEPHATATFPIQADIHPCSAPLSALPAGTYHFVVAFLVGPNNDYYLSSNTVILDVASDGSLRSP